jgi:rubrerythrin
MFAGRRLSMGKKLADVIDLAIKREEEAFVFYMEIFNRVEDTSVKDTLEFIAGEEKKHKAFLVNFRKGNYSASAMRMSDHVDYKLAEYLEEPSIEDNASSVQIYLVASHREARSHRFYSELANLQPEGDTKAMLLKMANEELKHKEKMEYLYTNAAFPQTSGG